MRFTFAVFFNFVIRILPLIAGLGLLITGIVITAGKKKSVKVLGIGYIISSLSVIMSSCSVFLVRMLPIRIYSNFSAGLTLVSFLCGIGSLVCICIFIHKNYGKKLIYIPVLAVYIGGYIINRIVLVLLSKVIVERNFAMWLSMVQSIDAFVIGAAVSLIIIIVFYKNRNNENVIPKMWLFETVALVIGASETLVRVIYYLSIINNHRIASSYDNVISLIMGISALAAVITPIYVTAMVHSVRSTPNQV